MYTSLRLFSIQFRFDGSIDFIELLTCLFVHIYARFVEIDLG